MLTAASINNITASFHNMIQIFILKNTKDIDFLIYIVWIDNKEYWENQEKLNEFGHGQLAFACETGHRFPMMNGGIYCAVLSYVLIFN